jgi:hypothetical protein
MSLQVDSYDNDLANEDVIAVMKLLKQAFRLAAEGGENPDVKWGDNDVADAISGVMSKIAQAYQDKMNLHERGEMNA